MKRRNLAWLALMALWASLGGMGLEASYASQTLFPTHLPGREWVRFRAEGFSRPACGVIYRLKDPVVNGVPLGGIDAGSLDLENSGLLGYCTIFNTHVPRRGPLNLPLLGVSVGGQTWVLCDPSQTKKYQPDPPWWWDRDGTAVRDHVAGPEKLSLTGVRTAREIHYWGHYPVADLEYETDAPVSVGLRAWAPFLPGDTEGSLIPGIIFEVHMRNESRSAQKGILALSFPGPTFGEAGTSRFRRYRIQDCFSGIWVSAPKSSYALGVVGLERLRLGGELGADGAAWARIAERLPEAGEHDPGASAAVDFALNPSESKVVRFVLTWYSPRWKGGGYPTSSQGNTFTHEYALRYRSPLAAARVLAHEHASILQRVLAWQEVIYTDRTLPIWLRESLVNMLHLFTETGMWAAARPPLPGWVRPEDGLFGMNESPRGCPQIECIPCSFYGSIPLVYFFPDLALSTLRGYKGYQDPEGAPPWIFGGATGHTAAIDFAMPTRGYQVTLNVPCYVDMLDRYLICYDDNKVLEEFYPSIKTAVEFMVDLNRGPDGIISMPDRIVSAPGIGVGWETEWFEFYEWHGMVTHVGAIHLATLRMAQRMAEQVGDEVFARRCAQWIAAGQDSMENKMWSGTSYLNFWDPSTGKKSDLVFGYQLDGEWMARSHGLPGVFRNDRVKTTLETIKRLNVPPTRYGAINYVHPEGSVLASGEWPMRGFYQPYDFFSPELFMLAATYMYEGQRDFGLELTRRCMYNIVCEQGITWDMPNIIRGDTGERLFGNDYYQNLMLWALPAAIEGEDLSAPVRRGGLVDRVIRAARGGRPQ